MSKKCLYHLCPYFNHYAFRSYFCDYDRRELSERDTDCKHKLSETDFGKMMGEIEAIEDEKKGEVTLLEEQIMAANVKYSQKVSELIAETLKFGGD